MPKTKLVPGARVRIVRFAVNNPGPQAEADRKELVGRTGVVIVNDLYVSVQLDDDPAHVPAAVLCVPSELEVLDADTTQAQSA